MIYRIDIQHYLNHAIDHFTRDELVHMQYAIFSAKINNGGRSANNMTKVLDLYPQAHIIENYAEYQDKKIFEKMYMDQLCGGTKGLREYDSIINQIYQIFIVPLKLHQDIVILCDEHENLYVDVFCKFLKKQYFIDVIDLNTLFKEGSIGPIYIDREKINHKTVDIARDAAREQMRLLSSTKDGRLKLISMMNKKDMIAKLKEIGITVNKSDMKDLEKILIEEWVNNEFDDEY